MPASPAWLAHLQRLTDPRGLLRSAVGDCPDRFSGYDTVDNAEGLRLCALASDSLDHGRLPILAKTCFGYLSRGQRQDFGVYPRCDATGAWFDDGRDDAVVQSRVARALAAVTRSRLPAPIRAAAAEWWTLLLEEHGDTAWTPVAVGNWLVAIESRGERDPAGGLDLVESMAHWLVEDCYYAVRAEGWEWAEAQWTPGAAVIPHGLWCAYRLTGENRLARVAETMTQFLTRALIRRDMLHPVGTRGGWLPGRDPAAFDQTPAEVASMVELLCAAERISGQENYGRQAGLSAEWFRGRNAAGAPMVDPETGGCRDLLTPTGPSPHQGASACLAFLITQLALARRPAVASEPGTALHPEPSAAPAEEEA